MTNEIVIKRIDKEAFYKRFRFYLIEVEDGDYAKAFREVKKLNYLFFIKMGNKIIVASKEKLNLRVFGFKEFCLLNDYVIFSMALKALGAIEYGMDFATNSLFYVVQANKTKVVAIKFSVWNRVLTFSTTTFLHSKKGNFERKGKRIIPSSTGNLIRKSVDKKSFVDFMRFKVDDNFQKSKMYALYEVSSRLKTYFPEIEWEFEKVGFKNFKITHTTKQKASTKLKNTILNEIKKINIVNYTDESSEVLESFLKNYGIEYKKTNTITDGYNITITLPSKEYEDNDPYHKDESQNNYIQNIVIDNLKNMTPVVFETLLKELIIKKEIKTKKLILPEHIFDGKFSFFLKDENVYGVEVDKDNLRFDIDTSEVERILEANNAKKGDFVVVKEDNISLIRKTNKHLIFELEVFKRAKKGMSLRRSEFKIVDAIKGIKYKENLYAIGLVDPPNTKLKKGFPIREIIVIKGENMHLEILEMMKEFFVRYKNLTIMPYPRKYIREYYGV